MKKAVIGYIYTGDLTKEERVFMREARKKNIRLVLLDEFRDLKEEMLKKKIDECDIIFNSSAEDFAIEFSKSIESLGKKVVDPTKTYYYIEDKWMFFLKCRENNIPTPETILLSENINVLKRELKDFNHWPVILKRVYGTVGEFVERADNVRDAVRVIKKLWKKGSERLPIIAQEFIESPSYRVTVIDGKIAQTALKENRSSWKATGNYGNHFKKFDVDKNMERIVKKTVSAVKIGVCGIDLLRKGNEWVVIEVNAEPALDFFDDEMSLLVSRTLSFLKAQALKARNHKASASFLSH